MDLRKATVREIGRGRGIIWGLSIPPLLAPRRRLRVVVEHLGSLIPVEVAPQPLPEDFFPNSSVEQVRPPGPLHPIRPILIHSIEPGVI